MNHRPAIVPPAAVGSVIGRAGTGFRRRPLHEFALRLWKIELEVIGVVLLPGGFGFGDPKGFDGEIGGRLFHAAGGAFDGAAGDSDHVNFHGRLFDHLGVVLVGLGGFGIVGQGEGDEDECTDKERQRSHSGAPGVDEIRRPLKRTLRFL